MTVWRKRAVEVLGAEAEGGAEFSLCEVLRSVAPVTPKRASEPAQDLIMLGTRTS